jgi:hypothetical protein
MNVELEVFDFDMDKAALIGPAPYAAQFAADMRTTHNNFGLLVDLSHFPTTYETSRFVVRTLRPYITHFHFGNAVVKPGVVTRPASPQAIPSAIRSRLVTISASEKRTSSGNPSLAMQSPSSRETELVRQHQARLNPPARVYVQNRKCQSKLRPRLFFNVSK